MPNIITWNSRGNPVNDQDKLSVLASILNGIYDVILLQECGRLNQADITNIRNGYHFYSSPHAGAHNLRCNSCIITRGRLTNVSRIDLPSANGRACIVGTYNNVLIGTLHSNANNAAACDAASVASRIRRYSNGLPIIIGGDFNVEPFDLTLTGNLAYRTRRRQVGTASRRADYSIACPPSNTHTSRNIYDYFMYTGRIRFSDTRTLLRNGGSDHLPVKSTYELL